MLVVNALIAQDSFSAPPHVELHRHSRQFQYIMYQCYVPVLVPPIMGMSTGIRNYVRMQKMQGMARSAKVTTLFTYLLYITCHNYMNFNYTYNVVSVLHQSSHSHIVKLTPMLFSIKERAFISRFIIISQ